MLVVSTRTRDICGFVRSDDPCELRRCLGKYREDIAPTPAGLTFSPNFEYGPALLSALAKVKRTKPPATYSCIESSFHWEEQAVPMYDRCYFSKYRSFHPIAPSFSSLTPPLRLLEKHNNACSMIPTVLVSLVFGKHSRSRARRSSAGIWRKRSDIARPKRDNETLLSETPSVIMIQAHPKCGFPLYLKTVA